MPRLKEHLSKGQTLLSLIVYCTEHPGDTFTYDSLFSQAFITRQSRLAPGIEHKLLQTKLKFFRKKSRADILTMVSIGLLLEVRPREYTVNPEFSLSEVL